MKHTQWHQGLFLDLSDDLDERLLVHDPVFCLSGGGNVGDQEWHHY